MGLGEALENRRQFVTLNPDARVRHRKSDRARRGVIGIVCDFDDHGSLVRELDRVTDEVDQNLVQAVRVTDQRAGDVGRQVAGEFEAFFVRPHGQDLDGLLDQVAEIEFDRLELDMAGLDFRQIEDIVDQMQQVAAGAPENAQILALIGREIRLPQQIRHPDDCVHGGPDFMADAGRKLAFGMAGHFRRLFRQSQGGFGLAPFGGFEREGGHRCQGTDDLCFVYVPSSRPSDVLRAENADDLPLLPDRGVEHRADSKRR